MSQARTAQRYAAFVRKKRIKMTNKIVIRTCPSCGEAMMNNFACKACGMYRGRSTRGDKPTTGGATKAKKVVKVKA